MTEENNNSASSSEAKTGAEEHQESDREEVSRSSPSSFDELGTPPDSDPAEVAAKRIISELEEKDLSLSDLGLFGDNKKELGGAVLEDRDRGILSSSDRDYLWGQSDYNQIQSEYKARERIRDRVRNAILDFTDIEINIEEDDKNRIFDKFDDSYLHDHMVMALRFFYRGLDCDSDAFASIVEQAVYEAETCPEHQQKEELLTANVSIDIERGKDPEMVENRLTDGEPLTDREIGLLVRNGKISEEQLIELTEQSREVASERVLRDRLRGDAESP